MLPTASAKFPVLDSVTACELLVDFTSRAVNVSAAVETLATGAVPVPVRLTVCVLPATPSLLSVMVSVSALVPVVVGLNVTLMVHELLAARLPPQVFVWVKSPLAVMLVMLSAALPVLLRITGCDPLVVPRFWLPNVKLIGAIVTAGAETTTMVEASADDLALSVFPTWSVAML